MLASVIFVKTATSRLRVVSRLWQRAKPLNQSTLGETKTKTEWTCRADPGLRPAASSQRQEAAANLVTSNTVGFEAYLERQGRNEFINLASQIAYDGTDIAFYFMRIKYENL